MFPSAVVNRVCLASLFLAGLLLSGSEAWAQRGGFRPGDRVEVNRGEKWTPATVLSASGSRIRVRLDDDGSLGDMPAERREKRLTRTYSASDMRPLRGEAPNTAPRASGTAPRASGTAPRAMADFPAFGGGLGGGAADGATQRTWSDQSGKFKIDATYRGMNGEKVILEKPDGSRIEVPLAKLADADQQYVSSQGGDPANPFAVASTPPAGGTLGGAVTMPQMMRGDKSGMKTVRPQSFDSWSFTPESTTAPSAPPRSPRDIVLSKLPNSKAFFEDIVQVKVAASGERALVVRQEGAPGGDDTVHIELVDLAAGRTLGAAPLPPEAEIRDVDADLGLVAYGFDTFHDRKNELVVAQIRGGQIQPVATWEPHADADWDPAKKVENARFLHGGSIATSTFHSDVLTVWEASTAKATLAIPVSSGFRDENLVTSPDNRYTAVATKAGIAIIDLPAGEHVATVKVPADENVKLNGHLAFNANNTKLAALTHQGMMVWDLKTGKLLQSFDHETTFSGYGVTWAGDFLFHRNRYLYDYQTRVLLWEFTGVTSHDVTSDCKNGLLVMVAKDRSQGTPTLRTIDIPTTEMEAQAEKLRTGGSLVVARAGDPVAIELDIDPGIISPDEVRRSVEANLQAAGYVVANNSDVVVTAVCKRLPSRTVQISDFHRSAFSRNNVQERTITPHPSSLTLSYKGQSVWRRGNMGQPGAVFNMREGESLDNALVRLTTPNTKLLTEAEFPQEIIRPGTATSSGAYGVTNLATGVSGGGSGRFD